MVGRQTLSFSRRIKKKRKPGGQIVSLVKEKKVDELKESLCIKI